MLRLLAHRLGWTLIRWGSRGMVSAGSVEYVGTSVKLDG
jgi:hypothetical protein